MSNKPEYGKHHSLSEKPISWFRLYADTVDDDKLRLLAFEDRWHFIAILCCKAKGIIDSADSLLHRRMAVRLGLSTRELEEVARRLSEVGLIDAQTLQPSGWEKRQFLSDTDPTAAERKRNQRLREKQEHQHVTRDVTEMSRVQRKSIEKEKEKETETETEKKSIPRAQKSVPTFENVDESVVQDFLALRKAKKSPVTQTAIDGIQREANKAGVTLQQALEICCARGWQGFKADWIKNDKPQQQAGFDPVAFVNRNRGSNSNEQPFIEGQHERLA